MAETYRVYAVDGSIDVPACDAREAWDLTPEDLRRGDRERAFMLLEEDDLGRRIPTVYKPIK